MDPSQLYGAVADFFATDDDDSTRRLLELANREWSAIHARSASPHDAETCRLAMLAAAKLGELVDLAKWRSRALSRFANLGWNEGVAAILVGSAFLELGRVNGDYPAGQFLDVIKPSQAAIDILAEAETCIAGTASGISVGPSSPSPQLIARFVHEKRGFLLLLEGQYDAARASYERALGIVGSSFRGRIKVQLGMELVSYVEAIRNGAKASEQVSELIIAEAGASGEVNVTDLVNIGRFNVGQMREGGLHLRPYEIL